MYVIAHTIWLSRGSILKPLSINFLSKTSFRRLSSNQFLSWYRLVLSRNVVSQRVNLLSINICRVVRIANIRFLCCVSGVYNGGEYRWISSSHVCVCVCVLERSRRRQCARALFADCETRQNISICLYIWLVRCTGNTLCTAARATFSKRFPPRRANGAYLEFGAWGAFPFSLNHFVPSPLVVVVVVIPRQRATNGTLNASTAHDVALWTCWAFVTCRCDLFLLGKGSNRRCLIRHTD